MRTFANVNEDNLVVNIAVFEDDSTPVDLGWSGWYETSRGIRKNPPSPGSIFVPEAEGYPLGLFYSPSPYNGWVLDENYDWQPPDDKPYPDGYGEPPETWWWDDVIEDWVEKSAIPDESE